MKDLLFNYKQQVQNSYWSDFTGNDPVVVLW